MAECAGGVRLAAAGCARPVVDQDERLQHEAMVEFFGRNYSRDGLGRCYVHGPQKVYVTLDAAPLVARRTPSGWSTLPYDDDVPARAAWLTPEGMLLIEIGGELAAVDDRDLPRCWTRARRDGMARWPRCRRAWPWARR